MTEFDVIVVGGGTVGLMLASELRLAGVRPVVLERPLQPRDTPKANGLGGQILEPLVRQSADALIRVNFSAWIRGIANA